MNLFSDTRPDGQALTANPAKPPAQARKVSAAPVDLTGLMTGKRPDQGSLDEARAALRERALGPIEAWSFSSLKQFETCRYATYLSKVKKAPRVESPAAERGTQMHDAAEHYVKGEGEDLPPPKLLDKMAHAVYHMRQAYAAHPEQFQLEENWGFTRHWNPTGFFDDDVWCRQKLDVFRMPSDTSCFVLDWKSGKKFGNEMKHADQGFQYALGAMMKYPSLQHARVEFWYTDHNQKLERDFTRGQVMGLLPRIEERAFAMTTATETELRVPSPTIGNCQWCDHAKTGTCEFATRPPDPEFQ